MIDWPLFVLALSISFCVSLVVTSLVISMVLTKQGLRAITPRRAQELGDELVLLVRAGGMEYDNAVEHYNREVGALRVSFFYPMAPIDQLYMAHVAFRRERFNEQYPDFLDLNPWRDA